jgi:hypothetical protein
MLRPRVLRAGKFFRSLMFLVDECTQPNKAAVEAARELPQQAVGQDGSRPSLTTVHEKSGHPQATQQQRAS